jgi:hypothetical protein
LTGVIPKSSVGLKERNKQKLRTSMVRKKSVSQANQKVVLECIHHNCPSCGQKMWSDYDNFRTIRTLSGAVGIRLKVRRCSHRECERYHQVYRPEEEGCWALPGHEFGLDLIAYVGSLRYIEHRSVPQIHKTLRQQGVNICQRSVSNILDRYDELISVSVTDKNRIEKLLGDQKQVILAIDGLQPQVGHEVLWVVRDCISESILLAKSLLSSRGKDISKMLCEVVEALPQTITAVVSDGQLSIRNAVAKALPNTPHQLCHYHYYKEAFKPIIEADRHAKKELKKLVRGVRPIERSVADQQDPVSEVVNGYCLAVRSALTDDGHPPLDAPGLRLHERLTKIHSSLEGLEKRGNFPNH